MNDLYQSEEWKSLNKLDRAQLLLVIEGLKKGSIIGGNWTSFMEVLKKTGLEYRLNTNKFLLNPVVVVAKIEDLQEQNKQYLNLPNNANENDFHKISGWFLGYPKCCTEEYVKERTSEQKIAEEKGPRYLSYLFGQELEHLIKTEGSYPRVFDYRPPSFTPCGINCLESIELLSSWKEAINCLDPEAGNALKYFNRAAYPQRLVHKKYLIQEGQKRNADYKTLLLRRNA
jgi:hypothetical protein